LELNLPQIHEAIAAAIPERDCIVHRGRQLSWSRVTEDTRRFAAFLSAHGVGRHGSLAGCEGWESPHDHVALYLHNGPEYLEAMLGTMKAGAAAVNVNYRYVADELAYLLTDSASVAVVYHEAFTPTLAAVLPSLPDLRVLVRVPDGSGHEPLAGSVDWDDALAGSDPSVVDDLARSWSGDDLYLLYTGGTTGSPKGVCWRQADFLVAALGLRAKDGSEFESLDPLVERARRSRLRALPAPPFMHGAAHWNAISAWTSGGTVVIQDRTEHLDPADLLDVCEREEATSMLIVGDPFARPIIDELRRRPRQLASLSVIMSGGAALTPRLADELLELLPHVSILDVLGSSESGRQGTRSTRAGRQAGTFAPSIGSVVLSHDLSRQLAAGEPEMGWLAQSGRTPRGYLGDPEKTARTFPVVDGVRYAVPGDRARRRADGTIELHGRDAVTINTGGEKVFAEEVEAALKTHPDVVDAIVVGRPSARWGQEVVAVVSVRSGTDPSDQSLLDACGEHLARYKLPKAIVRREQVQRSPAGKPDYAWARAQFDDAVGP
jgi:acyl-CoA synthetase (AMP-forming)/AMP-acid ligase II